MNLLRSAVGRKLIMAVTGLMMIGYLLGHIMGNLTIYFGEGINAYAKGLHSLPPMLWGVRVILILGIGFHIWKGIELTLENRAARPVAYEKKQSLRATLGSKSMIWTGLIILGFLVYHILHFTTHNLHGQFAGGHDSLGRHDVKGMVVGSFQVVGISVAYILSLLAVLLHVGHGGGSLLQTFGLSNKDTLPTIERGSKAFAWLLILAFLSIPITILAGLLG